MREQHKKDLLDKIAKALRRRQNLGLTKQAPAPPPVRPRPDIAKRSQVKMAQHYRPAQFSLHRQLDSAIFLSGSIGDVIALESFFTDAERARLKTILYATRKAADIKALFAALPNYPALKEQRTAWDDFSNLWCFYSKEECVKKIKLRDADLPPGLAGARDFGIFARFNDIMSGAAAYNGSSFVRHRLAAIDGFGLPEGYIAVCPYSTDKRLKDRDFDAADWGRCLAYLDAAGLKGVVLSVGGDPVPADPRLVDLTNRTTVAEAIEVVKAARGYVGIDSSMSVVAAKLFKAPRLVVKSVNPHCYQYAKCYYAPQTDFRFMARAVAVPANVDQPPAAPADPRDRKAITLNVCQGVGDIFWVYQKFAPHVDAIDFCVATVHGWSNKVQTRAVDFLRLLPKVGRVTTKTVSEPAYNDLAAGAFSLPAIMADFAAGRATHFDYACNKPLEAGVRIEEIDPAFAVEETVPLAVEAFPFEYGPKEYVSVYVSGSTLDAALAKRASLWGVDSWRDFIRGFYLKYDLKVPVVVLGADYDRAVAAALFAGLRQDGFKAKMYIDAPPAHVAYMLRGSKAFLGYQSGLNVIADNLDVSQVMMYFPSLRRMLYSWCKNRNINDGVFNAGTFDRKPQEVLAGLRLSL